MARYGVWKTDWKEIHSFDEYINRFNGKPDAIFLKLNEAFEYCGGKLFRQRCGYSGLINGTEFTVLRIE